MHPYNTTAVAGSHGMEIHHCATGEIDPATLYAILALRSAVFVVEQECVYLDLDGRDLEPSARQVWITHHGEVVATLRVLAEDGGVVRIGRVATRREARGKRLADALMRRALDLSAAHEVVLDAQTYLFDWYTRFGFERAGADFLDDGIPHVPMRRAPSDGPAPT